MANQESTPALLCADRKNHRLRMIDLRDGSVSKYAGSGVSGVKNVNCHALEFLFPYSICVDPTNPKCYYIGELTSIRHCDGRKVSLIAGGEIAGFSDGVGGAARFQYVQGLLATSDGRALYVSEGGNNRLRSIDLKTNLVTTICGDGQRENRDGVGTKASLDDPYEIAFDRSPDVSVQFESVLWIATTRSIRRFVIGTGTLLVLLCRGMCFGLR